jgi:hypothetical protein
MVNGLFMLHDFYVIFLDFIPSDPLRPRGFGMPGSDNQPVPLVFRERLVRVHNVHFPEPFSIVFLPFILCKKPL